MHKVGRMGITTSLVLLLLSGCLTTRIADLKSDPARYAGTEVQVSGTVESPFKIPLTDFTVYTLRDSTDTVLVLSETPREEGSSVNLKTRVMAYDNTSTMETTNQLVEKITAYLLEKDILGERGARLVARGVSTLAGGITGAASGLWCLIEVENS